MFQSLLLPRYMSEFELVLKIRFPSGGIISRPTAKLTKLLPKVSSVSSRNGTHINGFTAPVFTIKPPSVPSYPKRSSIVSTEANVPRIKSNSDRILTKVIAR